MSQISTHLWKLCWGQVTRLLYNHHMSGWYMMRSTLPRGWAQPSDIPDHKEWQKLSLFVFNLPTWLHRSSRCYLHLRESCTCTPVYPYGIVGSAWRQVERDHGGILNHARSKRHFMTLQNHIFHTRRCTDHTGWVHYLLGLPCPAVEREVGR